MSKTFVKSETMCIRALCTVYYVVFLTFFLGLKTASRQVGSFMNWNWHGSEIIQWN